jgi:MFS family permease
MIKKPMAKKGIIAGFIKDYREIPLSVRQACINLAIFVAGWGLGTDTYYSLYIKTIVDDLFLIGLFSAILAFVKLLMTLPVGEMDGRVDERKMLRLGKIIYAISGVLYFISGQLRSPILLLVTLVINGIANPMVFATTQSYIRQHSSQKNSCRVFGLYNAALGVTLVGGSLIVAPIAKYMELHWFYIAVIFFSLVSIPLDRKLPEKHKKPLLKEFKRVFFKENIYKKIILDLKNYNLDVYFMLFVIFIWGLLDYVGFIFVPVLALQYNLSLAQIAMLFAFMRIPYLISFFFADVADKKERMAVLGASITIAGILLGILASVNGFTPIILTSIGIALCLAIMRAVAAGVLTNLIMPKQRSEITGVQCFLARGGSILGSLTFGLVSSLIGIPFSFGILAIIVGLTGIVAFAMRQHQKNRGVLPHLNIPMGNIHFHPKFSKKKPDLPMPEK